MHDGHPLADQDRLRAFLLALAALDAGDGLRVHLELATLDECLHEAVAIARVVGTVVHHTLVVYGEVARDVHAVGAGHAVFAVGAGNGIELGVDAIGLLVQRQVGCGQRSNLRSLRGGNVFPDLAAKYPDKYSKKGLKDHCNDIHNYFKDHDLISKMQAAFENIPEQSMKPSDAYQCVVENKVERIEISKKIMGKTIAVMLVPYPPGIPIMMGGEIINEKSKHILDYMNTRQHFENEIPGYESDIHGVERIEKDDKFVFTTLCIKE